MTVKRRHERIAKQFWFSPTSSKLNEQVTKSTRSVSNAYIPPLRHGLTNVEATSYGSANPLLPPLPPSSLSKGAKMGSMDCQHLHATYARRTLTPISTLYVLYNYAECCIVTYFFHRQAIHITDMGITGICTASSTNKLRGAWLTDETQSRHNYEQRRNSYSSKTYMSTRPCPSTAWTVPLSTKNAILTHLPYSARQNKDITIQLQIFLIVCDL